MIDLILKFMFYACLGYVTEVFYVFMGTKKWINRGFLHGPYIPIYACGSILIIFFLSKYNESVIIVFLLGFLICSFLEYITSFIMEKVFSRRWWDYSSHRFNINGRVSLKNSFLFGLGAVAIIYLIEPLLININIKSNIKLIISILFSVVFLTDFILSSVEAFVTSKNIKLENVSKIKTRLLKAYPFLIKNNQDLFNKIKDKFKNK